MIKIIAICLFCFSASGAMAQYYADGTNVVDFENNLIWYRCTLGQTFNRDTSKCDGNPIKLNQEEIKVAISQANAQLGGNWRLPTRAELEALICNDCEAPKINKKYFPGTQSESYWTGQKNWISPKNYWSVNFMTGHSYGRFFPYQQLFVMIVQDK